MSGDVFKDGFQTAQKTDKRVKFIETVKRADKRVDVFKGFFKSARRALEGLILRGCFKTARKTNMRVELFQNMFSNRSNDE